MFTKAIAALALAGFLAACGGTPTNPVDNCIKNPSAPECNLGKAKK